MVVVVVVDRGGGGGRSRDGGGDSSGRCWWGWCKVVVVGLSGGRCHARPSTRAHFRIFLEVVCCSH
jgi:hypothetical protein